MPRVFGRSAPNGAIPWSEPAPSLPRGWEGTTRIFDLGIRPEAISFGRRHEAH